MSTSCCTGLSGCGCNACAPSNTIYRGTCTDPGSVNSGTYLVVLDSQFCENRLAGSTGILQSRVTGSGDFAIEFTSAPEVDLPTTQAVVGVAIPNLIGIDTNNLWYEILGPAVANQILMTNAAGQLSFVPIPAATVPDPLTIGTLNVTTAATIVALTITGAVVASGIASGTPTELLGLSGNNVVKRTIAQLSAAAAYFFESPTSPGAGYPNSGVTAGNLLTIGNLLYDSGNSIVSVTTSQTLTVAVAGFYTISWGGQMAHTVSSAWRTGIQLLINGIVVSNGGVNPNEALSSQQVNCTISAVFSRSLVAGDTIQLRINPAAGTNLATYEVWLNAECTPA